MSSTSTTIASQSTSNEEVEKGQVDMSKQQRHHPDDDNVHDVGNNNHDTTDYNCTNDHTTTRSLHMSDCIKKRKIRILVISMGGERRTIIEQMLSSYIQNGSIEIAFSSGIPSRELRTRSTLIHHCYQAQLIPKQEYIAYQKYLKDEELKKELQANGNQNTSTTKQTKVDKDDWTKCFVNVPVIPRRSVSSSPTQQQQVHYCIELWRKVKTVNRGRAVLACLLSHIIALRTLVTEQYDILLEDNVRIPINQQYFIQQLHHIMNAQNNYNDSCNTSMCHMKYYGWLGSLPNIRWIYQTYIPHETQQYVPNTTTMKVDTNCSSNNNHPTGDVAVVTVPCPIPSDIDRIGIGSNSCQNDERPNIIQDEEREGEDDNDDEVKRDEEDNTNEKEKKVVKDMNQPGGTNIVWGTYAYWISKDAYQIIIQTLQNDIGSFIWKGKRMRYYHIKPIDKIIPRMIRNHFINNNNTSSFNNSCIQIPIRPIFFRAPMLSSNIHTQWDESFCLSTHYQLQQIDKRQQQQSNSNDDDNTVYSLTSVTKLMTLTSKSDMNNNHPDTIEKKCHMTYQDLYLSDIEQKVVEYSQKHFNYTKWLTYREILEKENNG